MKKIYYLKTCDTCKRILNQVNTDGAFELQEIKTQPITASQLDELAAKTGSYEALFSRRSRQYLALGLKDKVLSEADYRQLILDEYTFLKRPVICIGEKVFCGSDKKTIAEALELLQK